jgi:hypothetical protein
MRHIIDVIKKNRRPTRKTTKRFKKQKKIFATETDWKTTRTALKMTDWETTRTALKMSQSSLDPV